MSDSDIVERFKKRKSKSGDAPASAPKPPAPAGSGAPVATVRPDVLLEELRGKIGAEKIEALIESCQHECLQAVIRPFGLARVLFEDKEGGNVDTVHNVRTQSKDDQGNLRFRDPAGREFVTDRAGVSLYPDGTAVPTGVAKKAVPINVYATEEERTKYENRGDYSYYDHHDGNADFKAAKEACGPGEDLDHPVSCKTIHSDRGVHLADLDSTVVANIPENHSPLASLDNRAKGSRSAAEYIAAYPDLVERRRKALQVLEELEARGELAGKQAEALAMLRDTPELDAQSLLDAEATARRAIDRKINHAYYTSGKFAANTALTSLSEGGRMAMQQALGVMLEEFVRACFAEVRDAWRNGFKGKVDDTFLDALKARLTRIAQRVADRWRDAAVAGLHGGISGFLSNLVTVLINAFVTTEKKMIRVIREGFMSLYRAMMLLASPPPGMSLAEAADGATKIIAAGLMVGAGIALEAALEPHLAFLGPFAAPVLGVSVGLVTGLATAFAIYLLDQLDLFGVNARSTHARIMSRLEDMIAVSKERAEAAAKVFDPPVLHHLQ